MAGRTSSKKRAGKTKVTNPALPKPLNFQDFEPLAQTELPALVLGINVPIEHLRDPEDAVVYAGLYDLNFKPGRVWRKIAHETCGVACKPVYWIGTVLKPTTYAERHIRNLAQAVRGMNLGWKGSPTLAALIAYQTLLTTLLNVGCDKSYAAYCEGLYPIDAGCAKWLTFEELPTDLDELVEWNSGMQRARGAESRWSLAVFGPNGAVQDKVRDR
jgi:hypothetical protein